MRREKQLLLDDIKERMASAQALVLARYDKLEPNKVAPFRSELSKTGSSLAVVKKRILCKAAQAAGFAIDSDALEGHIAVIFLDEDPFSTTKLIYQYSEENEKQIKVIGGRFEGAICSAQDVEQISKLPSKNEMRAQLLSILEAPMSQTLAVVEALLSSVMHCLDNKLDRKGQQNN